MTVRHSPESRLMLSRLAVELSAEQAAEQLSELVAAGVDVVLLTGVQRDEMVLTTRRRWGRSALIAVDNPVISADAYVLEAADDVRGVSGRDAAVGLVAESADRGSGTSFLVLRHVDQEGVKAAVLALPPLRAGALPWFVAGDFGVDDVTRLVNVGVRRIWLMGETTPERAKAVDEVLTRAWNSDPAAAVYRRVALLS